MFHYLNDSLELLCFHNLSRYTNISHCITTRIGGFSEGLYKSLNLSLNVGDKIENVKMNREKLTKFFGSDDKRLIIPSQCHTKNIKTITEESRNEDLTETDAIITNVGGIILSVMAADCVPIILYDPISKSVAAIHAGWKGTVRNIISFTIQDLIKNYNCDPVNIIAGIGPCISAGVYEVGEEVVVEFSKMFGDNSDIIKIKKEYNKPHIDLSEANRQLLIQHGVKEENIEVAGICTYENPGLFFSARRDGNKCGRFASAIMLNN